MLVELTNNCVHKMLATCFLIHSLFYSSTYICCIQNCGLCPIWQSGIEMKRSLLGMEVWSLLHCYARWCRKKDALSPCLLFHLFWHLSSSYLWNFTKWNAINIWHRYETSECKNNAMDISSRYQIALQENCNVGEPLFLLLI